MKVFLVDDHPIFLDGLKTLLAVRDIDVVGMAYDGCEAITKVRELLPEIILMDISMPHMDGLTATRIIKAEFPDIKIIMLTMSETDDDLFEAIQSGACGYLLKNEDTETLIERLMGLIRGEAPLSKGLTLRILNEFTKPKKEGKSSVQMNAANDFLTHRQIQVLTMVTQGLTYKEIGHKLFLSERTIKYHMGEIINKLHLKNRKQAIAYARKMKIKFS
jgi:two-component system NarL family response regulator